MNVTDEELQEFSKITKTKYGRKKAESGAIRACYSSIRTCYLPIRACFFDRAVEDTFVQQ